MDNIKAVIFDLDGTLIDSMWVWNKINEDYLKNYGYTASEELQDEITHLTLTETAIYFKEKFNITSKIDDMIHTWNNMAFDYYSNKIKLKDGVLEYINFLRDKKIKIALATSNSIPLLEVILKKNNIYHYFDAITTSEEVQKSKINPDIYLLSAKKLNVSPEECLVFEDIVQAVTGAKLAGMKVYAVDDNLPKNQKEELIKLADRYIMDFTELL